MKTKDFIKMLQEEDPTGECYIRMPSGIPYFVEQKPGYYDGPYSYLDEEGNYVTSTKENKLEIYTFSLYEFVEKWFDEKDIEGSWEKILSKLKFEFTCYGGEVRKEKEERVIKAVRKYFEEEIEARK